MNEVDKSFQNSRINWQIQATVLLITLVELGWILPWYHTLVRSIQLPLFMEALLLGGIMVLTYLTTKLVVSLYLISGFRFALPGGVLIVSLAIAGPALLGTSWIEFIRALISLELNAIFTFMVVCWMWWRGVTLAQERVHTHNIRNRFWIGLGMLIGNIIITSSAGLEEPGLGWFLSFLFVGFLSLVLTRIAFLAYHKVEVNPFDGRWLAGIGIFLGILLLLAALVSSLLTGRLSVVLDLLAQGVRWIGATLLFLAALPSLIIAGFLGNFINWLRNKLMFDESLLDEQIEDQLQIFSPEEDPNLEPWSSELNFLTPEIQSLIFWIMVLGILFWIIWRLGRHIQRTRTPESRLPESILEPGDAGKLIRKAFRNSFDDLLARFRRQPHSLPDQHIRRIYIQLLELFNELDQPRLLTQTPLEYLAVIQGRLPTVAEELFLLTEVYLHVRYGEIDEAQLPLESFDDAWKRVLKASGRSN